LLPNKSYNGSIFLFNKQTNMNISFEFFPPRTKAGRENLAQVRAELRTLKPIYFSTTFGAGGTTQDATLQTVLDIQKNDGVLAAPHLSCIGANKENLISLLNQYQTAGISRLVALRGDIPSGMRDIGDFNYANELVEFIKTHYDDFFHIEVAAYPEKHPQAKSIGTDLQHFVNKVNAGADGAITQYFYNVDAYFKFVDEAQKLGVSVPITPGIMPITNYAQLERFSTLCGAQIPSWILERLKDYENDSASLLAFGEEVVNQLCAQLKTGGVRDFHFYSMNKTQPVLSLVKNLI
jgi:methylenetetrahydrofolate reductase (NADPH)